MSTFFEYYRTILEQDDERVRTPYSKLFPVELKEFYNILTINSSADPVQALENLNLPDKTNADVCEVWFFLVMQRKWQFNMMLRFLQERSQSLADYISWLFAPDHQSNRLAISTFLFNLQKLKTGNRERID